MATVHEPNIAVRPPARESMSATCVCVCVNSEHTHAHGVHSDDVLTKVDGEYSKRLREGANVT